MFNPENPPELSVTRWFNAETNPSLDSLKGKVVVLTAFQVLCPGSKEHAIPQAQRLAKGFSSNEVAVIGLHMAFENQAEQSPGKIKEFLAESGVTIPVGIDAPNGKNPPKTMIAYEMQGTPTTLIFDRQGRLRRHYLGPVDDIRLSAEVMALSFEDRHAPREVSIAIERKLAEALVTPEQHNHGDGCGCGHDHGHDHGHHHHGHEHHHHAHDHHHDHDGACCGGDHDHSHTHSEPTKDKAAASAKSA